MLRLFEVIAILIFILAIISLVTMPWPANIIFVSLVITTFTIVFVYERRHKKKS